MRNTYKAGRYYLKVRGRGRGPVTASLTAQQAKVILQLALIGAFEFEEAGLMESNTL